MGAEERHEIKNLVVWLLVSARNAFIKRVLIHSDQSRGRMSLEGSGYWAQIGNICSSFKKRNA